ncbi:hypothetical protein Z043_117759 [Scleropages formosus]|uniref:Secreted protein n=1 Tax=Scleropages formosus TaxID=113540 RepID=A0A0P7UPZ2_SCLFO|nr:hypothetical protein Z043_117759 [Scleropages formosus]
MKVGGCGVAVCLCGGAGALDLTAAGCFRREKLLSLKRTPFGGYFGLFPLKCARPAEVGHHEASPRPVPPPLDLTKERGDEEGAGPFAPLVPFPPLLPLVLLFVCPPLEFRARLK